MSDYQKGALKDNHNLIKEANKNKVNVFIDPKSDSFEVYKNSFIVTPNRKEFEAVVGKCLNEKDIIKNSEILLESLPWEYYNFEGLGKWKDSNGNIYLTLVSDNQFSPLLKTEVKEFILNK